MKQLVLMTLIAQAKAFVGTKAYSQSFWQVGDGVKNIAQENGRSVGCALAMSSILHCFHPDGDSRRWLCQDIHTTVASFLLDLRQCGWKEFKPLPKKLQPGNVLVWARRRGNRHVGLYIGDGFAISTNPATLELTRHPWDREAEDYRVNRPVTLGYRHPFLTEEIFSLRRPVK